MMTARWVPMMAAMMLPSAVPAIARRAQERDARSGAPACGSASARASGLMAVLVALDPMSLPLMCVVGAIALIQKEISL
jgi:predicted metal-binding membrane protein